MGGNTEGTRLLSVVLCERAGTNRHKIKLIRFLGNTRDTFILWGQTLVQVSWRGCWVSILEKLKIWLDTALSSLLSLTHFCTEGWMRQSLEVFSCLILSVTWISDNTYSIPLWKIDQNRGRLLSLLEISFSSYPHCFLFHTVVPLHLWFFCLFLFLVMLFLLHTVREKMVTLFKWPWKI